MTVVTTAKSPQWGPVRVSPCSSAAAMDLNSCRHKIELAAAAKVSSKGNSLTIRQCLLDVGLSLTQASNRTMQARVRREVQRQTNQGRSLASRIIPSAASVPQEIFVPRYPQISADDFDDFDSWCAEVLDDDEISVLTNPLCFQTSCSPTTLPLHHEGSGTPRPTKHLFSTNTQPSYPLFDHISMAALRKAPFGAECDMFTRLSNHGRNSEAFRVSPDPMMMQIQAMSAPCLSQ